eukprot:scaffold1400_cov175-Amphora_coffeaeformis.AAC.13
MIGVGNIRHESLPAREIVVAPSGSERSIRHEFRMRRTIGMRFWLKHALLILIAAGIKDPGVWHELRQENARIVFG